MTRKVVLLVMFVSLSTLHAAPVDLGKVEAKVKEYYEMFAAISKNPMSEEAVNQVTSSDKFFGDINYQSAKWANDFAYIGLTGDNKTVTPYSYVSRYARLCEQRIIQKFKFEIISVKYNNNPVLLPEDKVPTRATAIVKKEIIHHAESGSKTDIMYDTLTVDLKSLYLSSVTNDAYTSNDSWFDAPLEEQLAKASEFYNRRKYEKAGKLYENILKKEPNQEEASYNLAVMYLHGKYGKKQHSRKERLAMAESLFRLSEKGLRVLDYYSSGKNPDIYK